MPTADSAAISNFTITEPYVCLETRFFMMKSTKKGRNNENAVDMCRYQ